MRIIKRLMLSVITITFLVYLGIVALLYGFQEKMIFPASKLPTDFIFEYDLPFQEYQIPVQGATLNALHFQQNQSRGLVFFLHGNAGNLDTWTSGVDFYQKNNYDLFIFDYRGYGKSTGKISSEKQLHQDVMAAWQFIKAQYQDKPIVIYGRSLGTGLAIELARHVDADQLTLVSPFISMERMAKKSYPFIPSIILRYPLRSDEKIADIKIPTLFLHGDQDYFIPPSHSEFLYAEMKENKDFHIIEGAGHNNIHQFEQYVKILSKALPDKKFTF